jgi:hypothetical protein
MTEEDFEKANELYREGKHAESFELLLKLSEAGYEESEVIEECKEYLNEINDGEEGTIRRDPVEKTEKYQKILIELEAKIDEKLKGSPRGMGYCFAYWHAKKEILKKDYGINWKSPGELNPGVMFD